MGLGIRTYRGVYFLTFELCHAAITALKYYNLVRLGVTDNPCVAAVAIDNEG
jgi:hypothetical protein